MHPKIQFTMETEENKSLPFLDLRIINNNGKLKYNNSEKDNSYFCTYHSTENSSMIYRLYNML